MKIHLGYEVGTGKAVEIPLRHLAVTGQTQASGKTTTLEALISRSGLRAVAFVTKRAERSFRQSHTILPYFRERADWQFVCALLEATLSERLKFQRSWIIRVCEPRGKPKAKTLAEVHRNVNQQLDNPKVRGIDRSVYEELNAYLNLVLPQMERMEYSQELKLRPGINVMNLIDYSPELQALIIRSVLEWVYKKEENTIVLIPEAWKFIPQERGSPVKLAAEYLIREGGAAKNWVWIDSQDIAGVGKNILRSVGVWILGVQREKNETKRTLEHIPVGAPLPKAKDVMTLGLGQFYVCFDSTMKKVYVQPAWATEQQACDVALGKFAADRIPTWTPPKEEEAVWKEKYEEERRQRRAAETAAAQEQVTMQQEINRLSQELSKLQAGAPAKMGAGAIPGKAKTAEAAAPTPVPSHTLERDPGPTTPLGSAQGDANGLYEQIVARLITDPRVLEVLSVQPELRVVVERPKLELDGKTTKGRIAKLIAEGYFDEVHNPNHALRELKRRGTPTGPQQAYRACKELAAMGFLTLEGDGYQVVPSMKVNLVEA